MVAYYAKRSQGEEFERLDGPLMHDCWVDGANISIDELNHITKLYKLNENIVYDVRDRQEQPRVEFNKDDVYTFLRLPHLAKSGHVAATPLLCIIKPTVFLTLSMQDTLSPPAIASSTVPMTTRNVHDLLLGVIAGVVTAYEELMRHTERSINDTANRLKSHEVTNRDFIHFVVVEDNLTAYRMNLDGILTVVKRLGDSRHNSTKPINRESIDDIALHIQQLLVAVESYGGRVESIRSAYSTIANNTLNLRIKTLTVFTVLITVPNVFYGMFGMNVGLPIAHEP